MNTMPRLSENQIRQQATEDSYARGVSYSSIGAVSALIFRDGHLYADVEGSELEPYQVTIAFDSDTVSSAECTCPYDWGGWCKHIVAALLTASNAPEFVEVRPPIAELLEGRDRDQLADLLLQLAQSSPAFAHAIELHLAAPVAQHVTPPMTRRPPAPPPDIQNFKRQVQRVFRSSHYDRYGMSSSILAEMDTLLAQVDALTESGDAVSALSLLEPLTNEYSQHWFEYDEDGELSDFFDTLGRSWARALLMSDLTEKERRPWKKKLQEWYREAQEYGVDFGFSSAILAAEQGWDDPQIMRAMRGEALESGHDGMQQELLSLRLEILQQQDRIDEYLNLARAAGHYRELTTMLAHQGQHAEALELARQHFSSADMALSLAQTLRERGDSQSALAIAEHGLTLAEPRVPLGSWLAEYAASLGNTQLALHAGEIALRSMPDLGLYQRLRSLDEAGWPERRERLLSHMRQTADSWQGANARVDIFLHEGLIDDAIRLVSTSSGWSSLVRVMDAAIASRPEWVIQQASKQAENIMDAGKAQHYDQAIEWLRRARSAYRAADNTREWKTYLSKLREAHGRKYKLMGLLDGLERSRE